MRTSEADRIDFAYRSSGSGVSLNSQLMFMRELIPDVPVREGRSGRVQRTVTKLAGRVEVFVKVVLGHTARCYQVSLCVKGERFLDSLLGVFGNRQYSPVCIIIQATNPVQPV
jgi:hypothetical protein